MLTYWKYYIYSLFAVAICVGLFLYEPGQDHVGAISMNGDGSWYRSYYSERSVSTEAHDRDVLFYGIGRSIEHLRQADIVILGHSMPLFAFDWRMIEGFTRKHGVRIFNMASSGDVSGEFLLRTIRKHAIHPFLFVINADDYIKSFFHPFLRTDCGEAGFVIKYGRWQAFKNVLSRNIRWRMEDRIRSIIPSSMADALFPNNVIINYRSARHGSWYNDLWPLFNDPSKSTVTNTREPDCHATETDFDEASQYLDALGNSHVVLTLVPHATSCRPRVREIAERMGVPFIDVDPNGMTYIDGGGHLDARGARLFTAEFLRQLEQTPAFLALLKMNKGEETPPGSAHEAGEYTSRN